MTDASRHTQHPNGQSQNPAVVLYDGKVMHARLKPRQHRFNYTVFSLMIDLDRLEEASHQSRFFSVNGRNLSSFHEKDHGPRDGSPLRPFIDQLLVKGGIKRPAKIRLWCNPRVFGYTFNPLSIYYCYDQDEQLSAIVYQVHNTFGQSHHYVGEVQRENRVGSGLRQTADKRFYVSPFLDMDMRYDFRLNMPDDALRIRILEHDKSGPILAATFSGHRYALNSRQLLLGICKNLGLTWKITAGIHLEALKLWVKGIGLRSRPAPPGEASFMNSREH